MPMTVAGRRIGWRTPTVLISCGVWLGGILFERMGSYDIVWWLSVCLGMASAVINLPIIEQPVPRSVTLLRPARMAS